MSTTSSPSERIKLGLPIFKANNISEDQKVQGGETWEGLRTAVVCGAGRGIGFALVQHLLALNSEVKVLATYRSHPPDAAPLLFALASRFPNRLVLYQADLCKEEHVIHLATLARKLAEDTHHDRPAVAREATNRPSIDLFINCIGHLHEASHQPEKKLEDVQVESVMLSFQRNSLVTLLLAKHFKPLLKSPLASAFCALSARVGSIGDNHLGGWYSYRASKAALNMMMRTIAIEFRNQNCNTIVLPLHPGTTETELSRPFVGRTHYTVRSPNETAELLCGVLANLTEKMSGEFFDHEGLSIEW